MSSWKHAADVARPYEGEDHAVPEPPEQFAKRLCQLKFTHRSDASAVQLANLVLNFGENFEEVKGKR